MPIGRLPARRRPRRDVLKQPDQAFEVVRRALERDGQCVARQGRRPHSFAAELMQLGKHMLPLARLRLMQRLCALSRAPGALPAWVRQAVPSFRLCYSGRP